MNIDTLTPIVAAMQELAEQANTKRFDFEKRSTEAGSPSQTAVFNNLKEQSLGEVVGIGKCLQVLVDIYPDEMNEITAVVE